MSDPYIYLDTLEIVLRSEPRLVAPEDVPHLLLVVMESCTAPDKDAREIRDALERKWEDETKAKVPPG